MGLHRRDASETYVWVVRRQIVKAASSFCRQGMLETLTSSFSGAGANALGRTGLTSSEGENDFEIKRADECHEANSV
jgi:hypothetical protein